MLESGMRDRGPRQQSYKSCRRPRDAFCRVLCLRVYHEKDETVCKQELKNGFALPGLALC